MIECSKGKPLSTTICRHLTIIAERRGEGIGSGESHVTDAETFRQPLDAGHSVRNSVAGDCQSLSADQTVRWTEPHWSGRRF